MRKFPIALIVSGGLLLTAPPAALADRPPPTRFAHEHYLTTPGGTHQIGPKSCPDNATQGFYGFHWNVHAGTPANDAFSNENNPVAISGARCPSA